MNILQNHLAQLKSELSQAARLSQMIYMWRDGLPVLFHSCIVEDPSIYMNHIQEFLTCCGVETLASLRTKKVFLTVSGFRVPMAGGRTLLHYMVEHEKDDAVKLLLENGFPSLPDDYDVRPEDLSSSESTQALLKSYGLERPANANAKLTAAIKKLMEEKPTADTFREPFLDCYPSPSLQIPTVDTVVSQSMEHGSVFVIQNFLTEEMRSTILDLYRSNLSSCNQAPNTMSKKGYSLRPTKLETFGYHMSKALNPFAKILGVPESAHPEIAHAFFVSYDSEAETLDKHRDGGFWTANLCLKADRCTQLLEFDTDTLKMEEGMLVLHKGCVPHAVTGSCAGERVNLIFWFY